MTSDHNETMKVAVDAGLALTKAVRRNAELEAEIARLKASNRALHRRTQFAERFQNTFMSLRNSWINYLMGLSFHAQEGFKSRADMYVDRVDRDFANKAITTLTAENENLSARVARLEAAYDRVSSANDELYRQLSVARRELKEGK